MNSPNACRPGMRRHVVFIFWFNSFQLCASSSARRSVSVRTCTCMTTSVHHDTVLAPDIARCTYPSADCRPCPQRPLAPRQDPAQGLPRAGGAGPAGAGRSSGCSRGQSVGHSQSQRKRAPRTLVPPPGPFACRCSVVRCLVAPEDCRIYFVSSYSQML